MRDPIGKLNLPWYRRLGWLYIPRKDGGPFLELFFPLPQGSVMAVPVFGRGAIRKLRGHLRNLSYRD